MQKTSKIQVPLIDSEKKAELEELDKKSEVLIQNQLPDTLSIEEAVAVMINLPHITEGNDVEGFLEAFLEEAEINSINASEKHTKDVWVTISKIHFHRLQLAKLLKEALKDELHSLEQGYNSKLRADIFTPEPYDIATSSLVDWAEDLNFGIKNFKIQRPWRSFRGRRYSTPYLEIIDDVIKNFYEEGGAEYKKPQNRTKKHIQRFIEKNYAEIPEYMIESICAILKPYITPPSKESKAGENENKWVTHTHVMKK